MGKIAILSFVQSTQFRTPFERVSDHLKKMFLDKNNYTWSETEIQTKLDKLGPKINTKLDKFNQTLIL